MRAAEATVPERDRLNVFTTSDAERKRDALKAKLVAAKARAAALEPRVALAERALVADAVSNNRADPRLNALTAARGTLEAVATSLAAMKVKAEALAQKQREAQASFTAIATAVAIAGSTTDVDQKRYAQSIAVLKGEEHARQTREVTALTTELVRAAENHALLSKQLGVDEGAAFEPDADSIAKSVKARQTAVGARLASNWVELVSRACELTPLQ